MWTLFVDSNPQVLEIQGLHMNRET